MTNHPTNPLQKAREAMKQHPIGSKIWWEKLDHLRQLENTPRKIP